MAFALKITKEEEETCKVRPRAFSKEGFLSVRNAIPFPTIYSMYSGKRALSLNVAGMEELKREGHSTLVCR